MRIADRPTQDPPAHRAGGTMSGSGIPGAAPGVGYPGSAGMWPVRAGTTWLLNNANDTSTPDLTFTFGGANDLPIVWRQLGCD